MDRSLRVAFLTPSFIGGVFRRKKFFIETAIANAGSQFDLYVKSLDDGGKNFLKSNARLVKIVGTSGGILDGRLYMQLAMGMLGQRPDVLCCSTDSLAAVGMSVGWLLNIRVLVYECVVMGRRKGLKRVVMGAQLRLADRIFVVSPVLRDLVISEFGVDVQRVVVMENQAIPVADGVTNEDVGRTRRDLGLGDDDFVFLMVGRLEDSDKRISDVVLALSKLDSMDGEMPVLVIVGDGSSRADLERLVSGLGLSDRVIFTGGVFDVGRFYKVGDVFVLPSAVEGRSNSLIEALSLGLPAIVSDIEPNKELVDGTGAARIFSLGDIDELENEMKRMMRDKELFNTSKECAKRLFEERLSGAEENVKKTLDVWHEVYEENKGGGRFFKRMGRVFFRN